MMQEITHEPPKMWGGSIIGFEEYHYHFDSGQEGDWFLCGFSPRKQHLAIYITSGFDQHAELLAKLGKYKTGKSCLYVKKLADIDTQTLRVLLQASVQFLKHKYQ